MHSSEEYKFMKHPSLICALSFEITSLCIFIKSRVSSTFSFSFLYFKAALHQLTSRLLFPAGDPKTWQNKSLPGDPNYLVGANCVSVLIDHF